MALFLLCVKFFSSVPDDFATFAGKHANTDISKTALSLIAKFQKVTQSPDKCGFCGNVCMRGKSVLRFDQISVQVSDNMFIVLCFEANL